MSRCAQLLRDIVGPPVPMLTVSEVGAYKFVAGGRSGKLVSLSFAADARQEDELILVVGRRPAGLEPSKRPPNAKTARGRPISERTDGSRVSAIDFWSAVHHFVVSFQASIPRTSPKYRDGLALIDSIS
jgi:hypothetical protein